MAPTNAKLKAVEAQISEVVADIEDLKAQVERAEIKLQHLREQEAADTTNFQRSSPSPFCRSTYPRGRASRNIHCMRPRQYPQSVGVPIAATLGSYTDLQWNATDRAGYSNHLDPYAYSALFYH